MFPLDLVADNRQHLPVMHRRRTRCLTCSAPKTRVEVRDRCWIQVDSTFRQPAHEVNPAARGVAFGAEDVIRRTDGKADPAMDTLEELFLVESGNAGQGLLFRFWGRGRGT